VPNLDPSGCLLSRGGRLIVGQVGDGQPIRAAVKDEFHSADVTAIAGTRLRSLVRRTKVS
jgi:hypothetical protein